MVIAIAAPMTSRAGEALARNAGRATGHPGHPRPSSVRARTVSTIAPPTSPPGRAVTRTDRGRTRDRALPWGPVTDTPAAAPSSSPGARWPRLLLLAPLALLAVFALVVG